MSKAFSFYGGQVQIGNQDGTTSPFLAETFETVSEVTKCGFSGSKVDLADVSNTQSPNRRREFLATLIDAGSFDFNMNYLPADASQNRINALMTAAQAIDFQVVLPASLGTFVFEGIITSNDVSLDFDKAATSSCKVKVTGDVLLVA